MIEIPEQEKKSASFYFFAIVIILIIVSMISLLWVDGFLSLVKWIPFITLAYILVLGMLFIAPFFLFENMARGKSVQQKFKGIVFIFIMIGFTASASIHAINLASPHIRSGDKAPQLLIANQKGANGIPDFAVTYWTYSPSQDMIEWGCDEIGKTFNEFLFDIERVNSHVFMLEDLIPETSYWYKINDIMYNFMTSPIENFSFAISSDPHFGELCNTHKNTDLILSTIKSDAYDYFFGLGDWVDTGFVDSQWELCLNKLSPCTSEVPTRPLIGNHDALFGGRYMYKDYFYPSSMPTESESQLWYHIVIGDVHLICIDLEWGSETFSNNQRYWLENELSDIDADDWVIVLSHSLFYSSKWDLLGSIQSNDQIDNINNIVPIFEEYGVDAVFSGHAHAMECIEHNGIVYNVIGTMGSNRFDHYASISSESIWHIENTHGFIGATINSTAIDVTYYDQNNAALFSYILSK